MVNLPPTLKPFAAALDGYIQEKLEGHIKGFMARLEGVEREQDTVTRILGQRREVDPETAQAQVDEIWSCKKCSARLGFYSPSEDILRVRYKEMILHTHVGVGGWVMVICRSCAEQNEIQYIAPKGVSQEDRGLRLDVSALERLLALAKADPEGAVILPLE